MANLTDFATVAAATAAGWSLRQGYHEKTIVRNGIAPGAPAFASFSKFLRGDTGMTGQLIDIEGADYPQPATPTVNGSATTARANALAALNGFRRHRYCGTPGVASGAVVIAWPSGKTPTADTD